MIVLKENERLYLKTWEYNAACILTELAEIVANNGGKVKPLKKAIISNRTLDSAKREYSEKLVRLKAMEQTKHNEKRAAVIKTYSEKLEKLENVDNEPVTVTHTSYISFIHDGFYYYYQVDSNPFFDFYYNKVKVDVKNDRFSRDIYSSYDEKEWLRDCFLSCNCSNNDKKEAANMIFNMLVQAKPSQVYRESKKQRVANLYDGGYHYETIVSPERFEKIDF